MPRIPDSIRKPDQILGQDSGTLKSLYAKARKLLALQAKIRAMIPGDIYVAGIEEGTLHLITPSSALATRVRYNQRQLVSTLRKNDKLQIERVKVSVKPDPVPVEPTQRTAIPISPENAHHLALAAKYIEDAALRKAMIRLADHSTDE